MIETQQSSISYTADGVQTQWEFPYSYFSVDDIKLFITQEGVRIQIAAADYTFNVTTKKVTYPLTGDPVAAGSTVELTRQTDITQLEDSSIQNFKSNDVERIADKLTLISQDLKQEMADIVAPEGGIVEQTVANMVSSAIAAHEASINAHTGHLVAKNGSTMSGNLTMSTSSKVVLSNNSNGSYNVFADNANSSNQLKLIDASSGTGVILDGANSNKPYYTDNSNSYRLLDTSDKTTLETSISGKANTDLSNCTQPYITDTYHSGSSWYRVWSDGWCEQGGRTTSVEETVTLHKEMADMNGYISVTPISTVPPGGTAGNPCGGFISTKQIYISSSQTSFSSAFWEVKGFIAEEE